MKQQLYYVELRSGYNDDGPAWMEKAGHGKVYIDEAVVEEYLKVMGLTELLKNKFIAIRFNNDSNVEKANRLSNKKLG